MKVTNKNLIESVLEWWKEHEYDVDVYDAGDGCMDERNVYSNAPEFVKIAKELNDSN